MRIAVVGSGNMSSALRRRVAATGHTVISGFSQVPAKVEPVAPGLTPNKFERMSGNEAERTRLAPRRDSAILDAISPTG
jgi:predicted dinucleotide-binding enzyme